MYQALYRKWRPRTFDDVVGQEHVTETLKRQVRENRVSHAYIFVGTRGTGKTTCAKILARAVNCEHPVNGNPCNCCKSCLGIEDGSVMDVEELDAASNNGVDNIRALRDEAVFSPSEVRKRVYIVDEVHMLSSSAFNALLKILEEPPEHLIFILATTEVRKIPPTILSRCQRFQFKRLSDDAMRRRMEYVANEEGLELTDDAAALLARLAEGSMRDGLSLLDQCAWEGRIDVNRVNSTVGLAGNAATSELIDAISNSDAGAALTVLDRLWREGKDVSAVLGELAGLIRDALILRITKDQANLLISGMYPQDMVASCAKQFGTARLINLLEVLQNAVSDINRSSTGKTVAELCLIRLCSDELNSSTSALISRIEVLENMVNNGYAGAPGATHTGGQSIKLDNAAAAETGTVTNVPDEKHGAVNEEHKPSAGSENLSRKTPVQPKNEQTAPTIQSTFTPEEKRSSDEKPGWQEVFETAKPKLERLARIYLSNSGNFRAELNGGRLELGIYSQPVLDYLDRDAVREVLSKSVTDVTGKPAVVSMAIAEPAPSKRNLDDLAKMLEMKGF